MEAPIKNPLDQLLPAIDKAIADWHAVNTPESISQKIHVLLDKNREQVVLKLMGFNAQYGRNWEIDHCNGRSGNSPIGNYLERTQESAIKQWVDEMKMPELTATVKKQIAGSLRETYARLMRQELDVLVRIKASSDAKELLESVTTPIEVKSYTDLINLLTPKE